MHDTLHSPGTSGAENIQLVGDGGYTVVACRHSWRYLFRMESSARVGLVSLRINWRLTIIDGKFGT